VVGIGGCERRDKRGWESEGGWGMELSSTSGKESGVRDREMVGRREGSESKESDGPCGRERDGEGSR
jgi:hypothetical protein